MKGLGSLAWGRERGGIDAASDALASLRAAPVAGFDAQFRTAGSTLEGLLLQYNDTYGMSPVSDAYQGFMSVPGAWRASILLSDLFGQAPFHSYRGGSSDVFGGQVPTPKNAPILENPAADTEDPVTVRASWGLDYIWQGNALGVYTSWGPNGMPTSLLPVPASMAGVREVTDGDGTGLAPGGVQYRIGSYVFDQSEIFHVKGPCAPGALRGMGVLETQLNTLRLTGELQRQARSIATAGVPTGVLKSENAEAGPTAMEAAKVKWIESQRTRTVAALGPFISFQPLSWNPDELQLVEARKFQLSELELIFGLPVGWLGGQTSSRTYSNIEQDAVNLLKFSTLAGMIARFESVFTRILPRGTSAVANREAILKSDTLTRYQAHMIATGKPWRTPDETRAIENMPPLGGDAAKLGVAPPAAPPAAEPTKPATDQQDGETQS